MWNIDQMLHTSFYLRYRQLFASTCFLRCKELQGVETYSTASHHMFSACLAPYSGFIICRDCFSKKQQRNINVIFRSNHISVPCMYAKIHEIHVATPKLDTQSHAVLPELSNASPFFAEICIN